MGKKIKKEMEAQRADFVSGAVERGVDRTRPEAIFGCWRALPTTASTKATPPPMRS